MTTPFQEEFAKLQNFSNVEGVNSKLTTPKIKTTPFQQEFNIWKNNPRLSSAEISASKAKIASDKANSAWGIAKNTLIGTGDTLYNAIGGILLPGATPEDLHNSQIMKDTLLGLPMAAFTVAKQIVTHPIDSAMGAVGGAARGISDEITGIITNLFVPKEYQEETSAQIKETLDKYLTPPDNNISKGFGIGGQAAPYIAAGGILGEAGGAIGGRVGGAVGEETGTLGTVEKNLANAKIGSRIGSTVGTVGGFMGVGQATIPTDSTLQMRAQQATKDLVALGLFKIGSKAFEFAKEKIYDGLKAKSVEDQKVVADKINEKVKEYTVPPEPPAEGGAPKTQSVSSILPNYREPTKTTETFSADEMKALKKQGFDDETIAKMQDALKPKEEQAPKLEETKPETPPTKEKEQTPEQTAKVESDATTLENEFKDDPTFKGTTFKEQAQKYNDLLNEDRQNVSDIAMGKKPAPEGVDATAVYKLFSEDPNLTGEEALRISQARNNPNSPGYVLSKAGQELSLSRIGKGGENPVSIMEDIAKGKEKELLKDTGEKDVVKAKTKLLNKFLDDITCK